MESESALQAPFILCLTLTSSGCFLAAAAAVTSLRGMGTLHRHVGGKAVGGYREYYIEFHYFYPKLLRLGLEILRPSHESRETLHRC